MKSGRDYRAYLLRLWRDGRHVPWRATLSDPHAGLQYGFSSLADLLAFLEEETGEKRGIPPPAPAPDPPA